MLYPNSLKSKPDRTAYWGSYPGHRGVDWKNFDHNHAIAAGEVIYADYNGTAGNEVRVRHANGDVSRYLHGARNLVEAGQWVPEGYPLQVQGTTGMSTGKHLHFEIWPGGDRSRRIDPEPYMAERVLTPAEAAAGAVTPIIYDYLEEELMSEQFYRFRHNGAIVLMDKGFMQHLSMDDFNLRKHLHKMRTGREPWVQDIGPGEGAPNTPNDTAVQTLQANGLTCLIKTDRGVASVNWELFPRIGGVAREDAREWRIQRNGPDKVGSYNG